MLAENLDAVALLTRNVCDINHGDIHTDIADIRCFLTINKTIAGATSQMARESIGIANRNGSNHGIAFQHALATIAHRFFLGHMAQLQNSGLERGNGLEIAGGTSLTGQTGIHRIITIETQSKTAHIQMALWEMHDTCRITDMAQYLMAKRSLELGASLIELTELLC